MSFPGRAKVLLGGEVELVGHERVQARGAERGEELEAGTAAEAGEREPLEDAGEAALGEEVAQALLAAGAGSFLPPRTA